MSVRKPWRPLSRNPAAQLRVHITELQPVFFFSDGADKEGNGSNRQRLVATKRLTLYGRLQTLGRLPNTSFKTHFAVCSEAIPCRKLCLEVLPVFFLYQGDKKNKKYFPRFLKIFFSGTRISMRNDLQTVHMCSYNAFEECLKVSRTPQITITRCKRCYGPKFTINLVRYKRWFAVIRSVKTETRWNSNVC